MYGITDTAIIKFKQMYAIQDYYNIGEKFLLRFKPTSY